MDFLGLFNHVFNPSMSGICLPAVEDDEKKLISIVHDITREEILKSPYYLDCDEEYFKTYNDSWSKNNDEELLYENEEFREKLEASKENLKRILNAFENAGKSREDFLDNFQNWRLLRLEVIDQLDKINKNIQNRKRFCNFGKLAGAGVGIAGGFAIAGAMLFPPAVPAILPAWLGGAAVAAYLPSFLLPAAAAAPVFTPLAVGGGIATGTGGIAVAGASVAEVALLHKSMTEVKDVLKADELGFVYLEAWFKHTQELIDAIEEVIGYGVMQSWFDDLETSLSWFKNFKEMGIEKFDLFKAVIKLCVRRMLMHADIVCALGLHLAPIIVAFLFTVFWLNKKNKFIFQCIEKMRELTTRFSRFLNPVQLTTFISTVVGNGVNATELIALSFSRKTFLKTFAAIGFAINIATVVLTAIDIKDGSPCKEAEKVSLVVKKLSEEYDVLEEVHVNLSSPKFHEKN